MNEVVTGGRRLRRPARRALGAVIAAAALALAGSVAAGLPATAATSSPVSYEDHQYPSVAQAPSADKPQSKLWFHDGSWWALMLNPAGDVNVFELRADHRWYDTGTLVDARVQSTADALWSGGKLYAASRTASGSGSIRVYRYSYSSASRRYTRDSGFPIRLPGGGSESVTIDRDSQGRLWATFTRGSAVWVAHSTTSEAAWTKPFRIQGVDTAVAADDISAVISLGDKIGVMWSDQASGAFRFAVHVDTDPDDVWTFETPLSGTRIPDDHINLKSLLGDDQGRVHAAVKTSLGDGGEPPSSAGILVLTRSAGGTWSNAVGATVGDGLTRPQLALDRTNRQLILLQSTEGGGTVYYKAAPLTDISFASGAGEPFIAWPGAKVNNVSTSKDPVDAASGLVAIAADDSSHRYYHAEMSLGDTPPSAETVTLTPPPTATSPGRFQVGTTA